MDATPGCSRCRRRASSKTPRRQSTEPAVPDRLRALVMLLGLGFRAAPRQLALLRTQRDLLAGMPLAVVNSLRSAVQLVGAALLLASISPWLLLLVPLGAVTMLTGHQSNQIWEQAREKNAERRRLRQQLFAL